MAKYSQETVKVCEAWIAEHGLMEYGGAKMLDYCAAMGIHDKTHRNWLKAHGEYAKAIERGKELFKITHTRKLFNTLMEAAMGGERETEEEHTEYRANPQNPSKPIIHKMLKHKRKSYHAPNVVAAIFLLCNLDPKHYQQRQRNDVSIKKPDNDDEMSLDEIKEEIERLTR